MIKMDVQNSPLHGAVYSDVAMPRTAKDPKVKKLRITQKDSWRADICLHCTKAECTGSEVCFKAAKKRQLELDKIKTKGF